MKQAILRPAQKQGYYNGDSRKPDVDNATIVEK